MKTFVERAGLAVLVSNAALEGREGADVST